MRNNKKKANIILSAILSVLGLSSALILPTYKNSVSAETAPEGFFVAGVTERSVNKFTSEDTYGSAGWNYNYAEVNAFSDSQNTNIFIPYGSAYDADNELKTRYPINNGTIDYNGLTLNVDGNTLKYSNGIEWNFKNYSIEADAVYIYTLQNDLRNANTPYIMLNNFMNEQNAVSEDGQNIQSFYFGLGKLITNASESMEITSAQVFLANDYVFSKFSTNENYNNQNDYGIYVKSHPGMGNEGKIVTQEQSYLPIGKKNDTWYNYFDLREVYAVTSDTGTELIEDAEGLYTIVISYVFTNSSGVSKNDTLVYQFYLMSDSSYYEAPDFNRSSDGLTYMQNTSGAGTYYNGYQQSSYPTYIYNATKYNVSYTHEYNSLTTYTTDFAINYKNNTETGVVNIYKNGTAFRTIEMKLNILDNSVAYYEGGNQIAKLKLVYNNSNSCTEYQLTLLNVRDYENVIVKTGPATSDNKPMPINYYMPIVADELGKYSFTNHYVVNGAIEKVNNTTDEYVCNFNIVKNLDNSQPKTVVDLLKNVNIVEGNTSLSGNQIFKECTYKNGYITLPEGYFYKLYLGDLYTDENCSTKYTGEYTINNNIVTLAETTHNVVDGQNLYYSIGDKKVNVAGKEYDIMQAFQHNDTTYFVKNNVVFSYKNTSEVVESSATVNNDGTVTIGETNYTPKSAIRYLDNSQYIVLYISDNKLCEDYSCNTEFKREAFDYGIINVAHINKKLYVKTKLYTDALGKNPVPTSVNYTIETLQVICNGASCNIYVNEIGNYFYINYNGSVYYLVDKLYTDPSCLEEYEASSLSSYKYSIEYYGTKQNGENYIGNRIVTISTYSTELMCDSFDYYYIDAYDDNNIIYLSKQLYQDARKENILVSSELNHEFNTNSVGVSINNVSYKLSDIIYLTSDPSVDGSYALVNYGTQAYFYKNNIKTDFEQLTSEFVIRSHITPIVNSYSSISPDNIISEFNNLKIEHNSIPTTDLFSIYFDYYGQYTYNNNNYTSHYYYISKDNYTIDGENHLQIKDTESVSQKQILLPSNGISSEGLIIAITQIDYTDLNNEVHTVTQYYAFIIDNSAPRVTLQYKDSTDGDATNLNNDTKYTNKNILLANWTVRTFFQSDIKCTVSEYPFNTNLNDPNAVPTRIYDYEMGSTISPIDGTESYTKDGIFVLTIYYGNKFGSSRDFIIKKDTQAPTAEIYDVLSVITEDENGAEITSEIISDVKSEYNIFNNKFIFTGATIKDSGASVDAYYIRIAFDNDIAFAPLKVADGVTTNIKLNTQNELFKSDNFTPFVLQERNGYNPTTSKMLGEEGSMLYIFKLVDSAGNTNYYYYIYDESTPYNVFLDSDGNTQNFNSSADNTIDKQTSAYWGNYKNIPLSGTPSDSEDKASFNTFAEYLNENTQAFKGLTLSENYLQLPLVNAVVTNTTTLTQNNVSVSYNFVATTPNTVGSTASILDSQFTAYLPGVTPATDYTKWHITDQNGENVASDFYPYVFQGSKTYSFVVTDILNNKNSNYLNINTDKSQFEFVLTQNNTILGKDYESVTRNKKAYNANKLQIQYNTIVNGVSVQYTPYVTYDFYPFSVESYISDESVSSKTQALTSNYYEIIDDTNQLGYFIPGYPFSVTPTKTNTVITTSTTTDGKFISNTINATDGTNSDEGLYVFKRVYKDQLGNTLTQSDIDNISENDVAELYLYVYVDRKEIFSLEYTAEGNVSTVNSFGDLIKIMLGCTSDGKNSKTTLDAHTLYTLSLNTSSSSSLFSTNKLYLNFEVPADKFATKNKLSATSNTTFEANTNNTDYFVKESKLYIDSECTEELTEFSYSINGKWATINSVSYPIIDNLVRIRGTRQIVNDTVTANANMFGYNLKLEYGTEVIENIKLEELINIVLNNSGVYTLTLSDNSYMLNEYGSAIDKTAHTQSFKFEITHTPPQGSYLSAINDSVASEIPLEIRNQADASNVIYRDINKDVLKFSFTDTLDAYKARINPTSINITKNGTTILSANSEQELNSLETTGVLRRELKECDCNCENCMVGNHSECLNEDFSEHHAYSYTYTIFDKFNDPDGVLYPSKCDEDAVYRATIQYVGEASSYLDSQGNSFYMATYEICVDRTAPVNNLQNIILSDRHNTYDTAENKAEYLKSYFFPISNSGSNPFVFVGGGVLASDSNTLYVREIDNPTTYSPSILPNETAAPSASGIPFNKDSSIYTALTYVNGEINVNTLLAYDANGNAFTFESNKYYEIVESDEAGNYTRYAIYVYNQNYSDFVVEYFLNENMLQNGESTSADVILDDENVNDIYMLKQISYKNTQDWNDNFINVKIVAIVDSVEQEIETLTCDGTKETITDFFERVVTRFNEISETTHNVYSYKLVIANRFGNDYELRLNIPGDPLQLLFDESTPNFLKVNIPAGINNVSLIEFNVERYENGDWVALVTDDAALGQTIIKEDSNGSSLEPLVTPYMFKEGQYRFTTKDNYERTNVVLMYVGSNYEDEYTITYSCEFVSERRQLNSFSYDENGALITGNSITTSVDVTSGNAEIRIDRSLWQISAIMFNGGKWQACNGNNYTILSIPNSSLSLARFTQPGIYCITTSWITNPDSKNNHFFEIKRNSLNVYYWSTSGSLDNQSGLTYNDDFTIQWFSDYATTGYITHTNAEGINSTVNFTNDIKQHLVQESGSYKLYIKNAIGETFERNFTKNKTDYNYYGVFNGSEQLSASPYTTTDASTLRTIHYYYVKYSNSIPNVHVDPNTTKNIKIVATQENALSIVDGKVVKNSGRDYNEYQVFTTIDDTDFVICLVRIYFVKETSDFANVVLKSENNTEIAINGNTISLNSNAILTFNQYSVGKEDDENGKNAYNTTEFCGNIIYADYYYNNEYVKTISSINSTAINQQSIALKRAGLHTFKFRDISGNTQWFTNISEDGATTQQVRELNIFIFNDIVYTINDDYPINNAIYNNAVNLDIITTISYDLTSADRNNNEIVKSYIQNIYNTDGLVVEITKNGAAYNADPVIGASKQTYSFIESGYYTISISGIVKVTDWTSNQTTKPVINHTLNTTYNFTIINPNIAKYSFNLPSNFGFTITQVLRNGGDITSSISNSDSIWLASGENSEDNAVYTITCKHYNDAIEKTQFFTFTVWINDSSPVIVPKNYTYGKSTKKPITLQYDLKNIYDEIGEGYIAIEHTTDSNLSSTISFDAKSPSGIKIFTINKTGTYKVCIYNNEDKLVSSYLAIKKTPLNASYKLIIIITSVVVVGLSVVFIYIRKKQKFR